MAGARMSMADGVASRRGSNSAGCLPPKQRAAVTRNLPLFLRLDHVELNIEKFESFANAFTHARGVLAYTAGEHHAVETAHQCGIRADGLAHSSTEDIDGKLRVRVAALQKRLHVVVRIGETLEAAFVIDQVFERVSVKRSGPHQIDQHARVEVTGAGSHGNAARRRETHACID